MNSTLDAQALRLQHYDSWTVNDLTDNGTVMLDSTHAQSGKQSGIGAYVQSLVRHGYIEFTGVVERSTAPHRKSGIVRRWRWTEAGHAWLTALGEQR